MKEPTAPQPRPGPASGSDARPPAATSPALMYNAANDEIHILDRLAVIYRYRRIVVTVFVLATAAMMIQGYSNVQVYQARAQILIEDERSTAVPGITSTDNTYYEDPEPYYKTQYRILKGRDLTRRVIKKLHLENVPEYNGTAVAPAGVPFVSELEAACRDSSSAATAATPAEAPKIDETPDESALVSAFIGHVAVTPVTGSRLVDITFTALDPKFAALAVNTLVDEYVEQNLALKLQGTQNMIDWLEQEVAKQQKKVQDSERGARRLPRQAERDVARRQAEHRALAAQQAERRRDDGADEEGAEGSPLQPDQGDRRAASRRKPFRRSRNRRRCRRAKGRVIEAQRTREAHGREVRREAPEPGQGQRRPSRRRSGSTSSKSAEPFSRSRTTTTPPCSKSRRWRGRSRRRRPTRRI